jgi:hypothetical protein
MIELKITIPNEDISDPEALKKRMALLGYAPRASGMWGRVEYPVLTKDEADATIASETAVANHSQEAKPEPVKKGRPKKAEAPNILAQPEHRVDPNVQAQDEADEAAEVATSEAVTAEDLRSVMGAYAAKFGMPATLEDGTAIFTGALGPPPESGWKLSVVAGIGGETLAKAVDAWFAAAAGEARYGT